MLRQLMEGSFRGVGNPTKMKLGRDFGGSPLNSSTATDFCCDLGYVT